MNNIIEKEIFWAEQSWLLINKRVIFWKEYKALILSDIHIGKAAHFRRSGIPIPNLIHQKDLETLGYLIQYYDVKQLIIVGDLIHASSNGEVQHFADFLTQFPSLKTILIRGNHDRFSENALLSLGITQVCDTLDLHGIRFVHEPDKKSDHYQISGHIHPGVAFRLPTKGIVRMPSFVVSNKNLILPAFSQFTGLDTSIHHPDAKYYAFYDKGFVEFTHQKD